MAGTRHAIDVLSHLIDPPPTDEPAPSLPGLTFVNTALNSDGTVTLTANSVVTNQGTYTGSLTLYVTSGASITVPVSLTLGTGGGGTGGRAVAAEG